MPDEETWIARLTPVAGVSVARLLALPLGLDVWERHPDHLVVAAPEDLLAEIERRVLATVERVTTTAQHVARPVGRPPTEDGS